MIFYRTDRFVVVWSGVGESVLWVRFGRYLSYVWVECAGMVFVVRSTNARGDEVGRIQVVYHSSCGCSSFSDPVRLDRRFVGHATQRFVGVVAISVKGRFIGLVCGGGYEYVLLHLLGRFYGVLLYHVRVAAFWYHEDGARRVGPRLFNGVLNGGDFSAAQESVRRRSVEGHGTVAIVLFQVVGQFCGLFSWLQFRFLRSNGDLGTQAPLPTALCFFI